MKKLTLKGGSKWHQKNKRKKAKNNNAKSKRIPKTPTRGGG
jgi:hypothetical protein